MHGEIFLQGLISFLIVAFGQPSFAPWLGPIAASFGYALFWRAIRIYPFRQQRFWRAFLWYGSISLIQLSWMASVEFQGIYILFVWVALAVWLGVQFGILSILIPYNRNLSIMRILAIASIWTLLEWSRYYYVLCGYSWNLSGIALSNTYAMQFAALFGVLGLSFWVILVNLLGFKAFIKKGIPRYLIWGAAACMPYLFGIIHIAYHDKQLAKMKNPTPFSCLLVQTGLLPSEKVPLQGKIRSFISPYDQWKRILQFVKEEGRKTTDLIVLPEAAVPYSFAATPYEKWVVDAIFNEVFGSTVKDIFPKNELPFVDHLTERVSNAYWVHALSNLYGCEVVFGLDHIDESGLSYNSAFHVAAHGKILSRYDKRVLMPLAEYLPFKWLYPLVRSYGVTEFFTHGGKATLFDGKLPMSACVCYEETFPDKIREGRLEGAKLFVNVTNDGWYPYTRLPSQHFEHAKFRAIENGIPLIRACNTGMSAVVDAMGRTVKVLNPYDEKKQILAGALYTQFIPYEFSTLFMIWGNLGIVSICIAILAVFLVFKKMLQW